MTHPGVSDEPYFQTCSGCFLYACTGRFRTSNFPDATAQTQQHTATTRDAAAPQLHSLLSRRGRCSSFRPNARCRNRNCHNDAVRAAAFQHPDNDPAFQYPDNDSAFQYPDNDSTFQCRDNDPAFQHRDIDSARQQPDNDPARHELDADSACQHPNNDPARQHPDNDPARHELDADSTNQQPDNYPARHEVDANSRNQSGERTW